MKLKICYYLENDAYLSEMIFVVKPNFRDRLQKLPVLFKVYSMREQN